MASDFPQSIQSKLDVLTPRQFERLAIHLELPIGSCEDRDMRYKAFRAMWGCVYPFNSAVFEYLDKAIVSVVQGKDIPSLSLLPSNELNNKPEPDTLPSSPPQNPPAQKSRQSGLDLRAMPPADTGFRVAFSFAGEERALVRSIAEACEARLGRGTVFYDECFQHVLCGYGSDMFLQNIYGKQTQMIVLCVAKHYAQKAWTLAEHDAIMARIMALRASAEPRDRLRFLPIRVGEGEVPGVLPNAITFDARAPGRSPADIAELIVHRLAEIDA